ncbi:MAG: Ig-like domain-containing protein, partial [Prevotella sp.]|nr:Ig-like domain-containing protein [Prevotella sp.]
SIINAEYSTDGQTFTSFGTYNLPNRGWDSQEFDLPAEAADKDRVYIRFMPDYTSPKTGVESTNDGTSLAEIFILADATGAAEEVATLVSSNPAQNATDVSANGSVILTFDNKVKAGEGTATLNGEEITPTISGKMAIFKYAGLKYSTNYTFSMPEGVLVSRSGQPVAAASISFTTMERKQPEAKVYDAIVAADGSGDFTTVQAAIDAAPEGRGTAYLIFVKNGMYKEHVDIPATKPYLHIIGQNRDKTVIYDDQLCGGPTAVHVSVGATVVVNANNIFFENITLENSYGHEKQEGPQALALNTIGDRIALNNVALLSYQDTWITSSNQKNRHYIKNSLIEGAVDFIYNGGDVYLDGDTLEINRPSGGYIVAPNHTSDSKWGYVFQNNVIRAHEGVSVSDVWLGRPWHGTPKTVFINTQTFINIPAKGWYNTMGGLPAIWAEYNTVDAKGNPVDLSQRETYYYYWIDEEKTQKAEVFDVKNTLTAEEAAQYTLKNVLSGDDNWQPDLLCEAVEAPVPVIKDNKIEWEAVPYAICYVVTKGDEVVDITTETSYDMPLES